MEAKKILITGACGYLGSALLKSLDHLDANFEINILDNFSSGSYSSLLDLSGKHKHSLIESDIMNPYALKSALKGVDTVIHLAALVLTPMGLGRTRSAEQINHWGTVSLLEAALKAKVKHVIFTSTTAVFGPVRDNEPSTQFNPFGAYASSKYNAEKSVKTFIKRGLNTTILRLGTLYGLAPVTRYDSVVNKFIVNACTRNSINLHGTGNQTRPLLNISDAVGSIIHVLKNPPKENHIFNVFEKNYSIKEVVDKIVELKPEININFINQDFRNHYSFFIQSNIDTIPGFVFKSDMISTLKSAFNHFKHFDKINYHV